MELSWGQALLLACVPGLPGLLMLVVGVALIVYGRRKVSRCTAVTTGSVCDYRFLGGEDNDGIVPVVSYEVAGRRYEVVRRFRSVSSMIVHAPWLPRGEAELWVSDDDVLHVKGKGRSIDYGTPARRLWPLGSPMTVFYDPGNPRRAFAQVKRAGSAVGGWLLAVFGGVLLFVVTPTMLALIMM